MKIHHICIQTNCYEESKKFYMEVLGFKIIQETKNFHGRDYIIARNSKKVGESSH